MSQLETLPAPMLPSFPEDKWEREKRAFKAMLASLLTTHRGQFVAIHEGEVVESGLEKLEVAGRAYARFGYIPIFVSLVTDEAQPLARIPSPRNVVVEKSS
ncbi:MAG: hypothetical protein HYR84_00650 [Planctomycetes bacterium]|nr:hypothetical protein [Planctomycetota bacterium]